MSYRLINTNSIVSQCPEVNDMPCIYVDLDNGLDGCYYDLRGVNALQAENTKLRELMHIMAYCMQYERECDECKLNGADGVVTEHVGCDGLHERLCELGIEVG